MITSLNSSNRLLFVMEMHHAFRDVQTELLKTIYMNSMNIRAQNSDGKSAFTRTRSFMNVITKAHHLSQMNPVPLSTLHWYWVTYDYSHNCVDTCWVNSFIFFNRRKIWGEMKYGTLFFAFSWGKKQTVLVNSLHIRRTMVVTTMLL
jgi:hypothetical protein